MQQKKQRMFYLFIAILLALSGLLGVLTVFTPDSRAQQFTACYDEFGGIKRVAGDDCEYEFQSGATLDIQSGATLIYEDVAVSGPMTFGSQTAATDGVTITHGLGTTPTVIFLQPVWTTAGVTQTLYPANIGATTFSIEFTTGTVTNTTAYWQAGK